MSKFFSINPVETVYNNLLYGHEEYFPIDDSEEKKGFFKLLAYLEQNCINEFSEYHGDYYLAIYYRMPNDKVIRVLYNDDIGVYSSVKRVASPVACF